VTRVAVRWCSCAAASWPASRHSSAGTSTPEEMITAAPSGVWRPRGVPDGLVVVVAGTHRLQPAVGGAAIRDCEDMVDVSRGFFRSARPPAPTLSRHQGRCGRS
jgi:hypothetical protein